MASPAHNDVQLTCPAGPVDLMPLSTTNNSLIAQTINLENKALPNDSEFYKLADCIFGDFLGADAYKFYDCEVLDAETVALESNGLKIATL